MRVELDQSNCEKREWFEFPKRKNHRLVGKSNPISQITVLASKNVKLSNARFPRACSQKTLVQLVNCLTDRITEIYFIATLHRSGKDFFLCVSYGFSEPT